MSKEAGCVATPGASPGHEKTKRAVVGASGARVKPDQYRTEVRRGLTLGTTGPPRSLEASEITGEKSNSKTPDSDAQGDLHGLSQIVRLFNI